MGLLTETRLNLILIMFIERLLRLAFTLFKAEFVETYIDNGEGRLLMPA
jgi:hypothetical protein